MSDVTTVNGWTRVAFGDVVRQVRDRVDPATSGLQWFVAGEHMDTDDLRIRRWGTIGDGYLGPAFHVHFRPGQVLYGSRRTYLRKVALADFEGVTANTTFVIESKNPDVLVPEFLPFIMRTRLFHEHSIRQSKGSVNPYVNFSDLTWYEFDLPPVDEQRRIVEVLTSVRDVEESHEAAGTAVAGLVASHAREHFQRLLDDPSVPVHPLNDLIDGGVSNGIFRKREEFGSGLPLINVTDCYKGFRVTISQLDRVPVTSGEYVSFSAEPGDVIFNRSSLVVSGIGHTCLVPDLTERVVFECHLMRVRPEKALLHGAFLARYALSPIGRRYILGRAQTTTMTTMGQGDLQAMPVPCPDLERQKAIADELDAIDAAAQMIRARQSEVRSLGANLLSAIWQV